MLGKKKTYRKPEIETFEIDSEISLVMMTSPPQDPEDVPFASFEVDPSGGRVFKNDIPSESESPFGEDVPKY